MERMNLFVRQLVDFWPSSGQHLKFSIPFCETWWKFENQIFNGSIQWWSKNFPPPPTVFWKVIKSTLTSRGNKPYSRQSFSGPRLGAYKARWVGFAPTIRRVTSVSTISNIASLCVPLICEYPNHKIVLIQPFETSHKNWTFKMTNFSIFIEKNKSWQLLR
jgi:hypothetical protein